MRFNSFSLQANVLI